MANELTVVAPKSMAELKDLAQMVAPGISVPQAVQGKPGDVAAIIMAGAEMGLYPMQALRSIHIIKGRVSMSAEGQVAIVKGRPDICEYFQCAESTSTTCTYETKRKGNPKPTRMTWTIEQAKQAGLMANEQWTKYPAEMLRARCSKALCRAEYPDLTLGMPEDDEVAREPSRVESEIPAAITSPASSKSRRAAIEAEFIPVAHEASPGVIDGPSSLPQDAEPVAPAASDTALALIAAASDISGLRAVAASIGTIDDPARKALVGSAYNAKMTALRGGK